MVWVQPDTLTEKWVGFVGARLKPVSGRAKVVLGTDIYNSFCAGS
jgi:hypothetical protein